MCDLCVYYFWHSLPQKDTLRLYYLNLKRVRASLRAFWPENNMRRLSWKETNKSLAEINLHFEAADCWGIIASSRWERLWHHGFVPLKFENDDLKEWRPVCCIQNSLGFHWVAFCWTIIHEMHKYAIFMVIV